MLAIRFLLFVTFPCAFFSFSGICVHIAAYEWPSFHNILCIISNFAFKCSHNSDTHFGILYLNAYVSLLLKYQIFQVIDQSGEFSLLLQFFVQTGHFSLKNTVLALFLDILKLWPFCELFRWNTNLCSSCLPSWIIIPSSASSSILRAIVSFNYSPELLVVLHVRITWRKWTLNNAGYRQQSWSTSGLIFTCLGIILSYLKLLYFFFFVIRTWWHIFNVVGKIFST
jgi:hypothetical protein